MAIELGAKRDTWRAGGSVKFDIRKSESKGREIQMGASTSKRRTSLQNAAMVAGACVGSSVLTIMAMRYFASNSQRQEGPVLEVPPPTPASPGGSPRAVKGMETKQIKPPFPQEVASLLNRTRLCYLSTTGKEGEPHLSLMNFTYVQDEEIIIVSTRRDTLKARNILESKKIAILIHDFPHLRKGKVPEEGCTYSITLYGTAKIQEGETAEKYTQFQINYKSVVSNFRGKPTAHYCFACGAVNLRSELQGQHCRHRIKSSKAEADKYAIEPQVPDPTPEKQP